MMFVMVTGDHLILGTRRIVIYMSIATCLSTPGMVMLHFLPPYLHYWQIPCYFLSFFLMSVTICTFSSIFQSLFRAATLLNNCFKVRNSINFMHEEISQHSVRIHCLIFMFFLYFYWKFTLLNFSFSHHDLLRSAFKCRIIANYLGKSKIYRMCHK